MYISEWCFFSPTALGLFQACFHTRNRGNIQLWGVQHQLVKVSAWIPMVDHGRWSLVVSQVLRSLPRTSEGNTSCNYARFDHVQGIFFWEIIPNRCVVGGLEPDFSFSIYWECPHPNPTDFPIFQRGRYTTNQMLFVASKWRGETNRRWGDRARRLVVPGQGAVTARGGMSGTGAGPLFVPHITLHWSHQGSKYPIRNYNISQTRLENCEILEILCG